MSKFKKQILQSNLPTSYVSLFIPIRLQTANIYEHKKPAQSLSL